MAVGKSLGVTIIFYKISSTQIISITYLNIVENVFYSCCFCKSPFVKLLSFWKSKIDYSIPWSLWTFHTFLVFYVYLFELMCQSVSLFRKIPTQKVRCVFVYFFFLCNFLIPLRHGYLFPQQNQSCYREVKFGLKARHLRKNAANSHECFLARHDL